VENKYLQTRKKPKYDNNKKRLTRNTKKLYDISIRENIQKKIKTIYGR